MIALSMALAGAILESAFRAAIVRTFRRDCVDIHFPPLANTCVEFPQNAPHQ
jgi:hypothetical protein